MELMAKEEKPQFYTESQTEQQCDILSRPWYLYGQKDEKYVM